MIKLRYFKPEEFTCKCGKCGGGIEKMDPECLRMLDEARVYFGLPMVLNSAYRCPAHNKAEGSTSDNHPSGHAVDIKCLHSVTRAKLIEALWLAGFKRIGLHKTFIHADNRKIEPLFCMWFY